MRWAGLVARMEELCTRCWWGNQRERDHWEDQGVDGRIILKIIFKKWDEKAWDEILWLRIRTAGGHW
jgi:hypothetical protein